jgi:Ca2+/Na+ antiporter
VVLAIGLLIAGLVLLAFSSDRAVDIAARLAATARIPPLLIGIYLASYLLFI